MLIKNGTRFGIAIPQMFAPGTAVDLSLIEAHLIRAEALGFESVWVQDQTLGTMQTLDPLALLAYAATHTRAMKLGVSVLVIPFRNPINLAKTMATLDHLSGGRMILGVGIGGNESQYPAFGITPARRVRRFEESVRVLKRLWAESEVDFAGELWRLERVTVAPRPLQRPGIPIWFGAGADAALHRSARMGDGWMGAGGSSSAAFKTAIAKVRAYLGELGRDPDTYPLSKRVYVALDKDRRSAARKLEQWFASYYGTADFALEVSIYGTEPEVIDGLGELMLSKPDMLMLNPVYDLLEHPERLATEVIPKL